ncbi:hypothetical protein [Clostridium sp. ZS2-4]|uniref:hypothetical protein n=1 Tax=Clostridium sp. ZS2-4 TaxID=2987703 RepID=UPI00227A9B14|nr:hypothetical protein [Clostridium sp. ZS2-4]MCY6354382.1 hypothetical protein [Clostridium sp. ZS2-4]
MDKEVFNLMNIFEGYVRNYRRLNLYQANNRSMFTKKEIDYFTQLGEMLGYFSFVEDTKPNKDYGRSRPMDLAWWKSDERIDKECFTKLVLHLERENLWNKDIETLDKLFCKTEEKYIPTNVIGIQNVESVSRIKYLNGIVTERNNKQHSNVLMVYRFYDEDIKFDRVWAYYFSENELVEERKAICKIDDMGYWSMCFEEEYQHELR